MAKKQDTNLKIIELTGGAVSFKAPGSVRVLNTINLLRSGYDARHAKPTPPVKRLQVDKDVFVDSVDTQDAEYVAALADYEAQRELDVSMRLMSYIASFVVLTDEQKREAAIERERMARIGLNDLPTDDGLFWLQAVGMQKSSDMQAVISLASVDEIESEVKKG